MRATAIQATSTLCFSIQPSHSKTLSRMAFRSRSWPVLAALAEEEIERCIGPVPVFAETIR
jgi:hypothetical protein